MRCTWINEHYIAGTYIAGTESGLRATGVGRSSICTSVGY